MEVLGRAVKVSKGTPAARQRVLTRDMEPEGKKLPGSGRSSLVDNLSVSVKRAESSLSVVGAATAASPRTIAYS
jgi:hypothetical protein